MRLKMGYFRRLFFTLIVVSVIFLVIYVQRQSILIMDRSSTLEEIEKAIKQQSSGKACKHPNLPVNSPEMNKFFFDVPPINCSAAGIDWVIVKGSYCIITAEAKRKFGEIHCQFTDLIRKNDFSISEGETKHTSQRYKLTISDVVRVQCKSQTGNYWKAVLTGIRDDKRIHARFNSAVIPDNVLPLNVLIFGFDSLSHNTFIRKLPKTYEYLTETLKSQVLNGYNIVGDGTPQALIPILTGQTELELPETRKRIFNSNFVNVYPFVWKEFQRLGYVTGYLEDTPSTGIFTYRLRGFDKPPTDHYMRPYYLAADDSFKSYPKYCAGAIPRHKIMLNYIENFFNKYKNQPAFLFGFHGELSHDSINLIGTADSDVVEWLQRLSSAGILNNTLLMFMSDHGHRFTEIRDTIQGKQEERLPFFSIALPEWVRKKYPTAFNNLRSNVERLTTPFDIYPTIKHLLNWNSFQLGDLKQRSISLFDQIPEERSCADAYIEAHWCTCLEWEQISIDSQIVTNLSQALVDKLNSLTVNVRHLCNELRIKKIYWAMKLSPNNNMLKFQRSADYDGFVADLSAKVTIQSHLYQIKVKTSPNNGVYEASITHFNNGVIHVNDNDISRIDKYGAQSLCIFSLFPDLRKYCHCKS